MNDKKNGFDILTTPQEWEDINLYNLWRDCNLWNNSDLYDLLFLNKDGISYCEYGWFCRGGVQINFTFKFIGQNTLKLTYLESPDRGFTPTEDNLTKEIIYQIVEVTEDGLWNHYGRWNKLEKGKVAPYWLLTLNESPYPDGAAPSPLGKFEYYGSR
ncbi:MAG: hypothetical protein QOJ64_734 [Acidobacteriota bacterium]|jgi:hypothetical protein|nr:hypothetical protein [Acidobacteriota bacterium]